jgi:hypothetical protein
MYVCMYVCMYSFMYDSYACMYVCMYVRNTMKCWYVYVHCHVMYAKRLYGHLPMRRHTQQQHAYASAVVCVCVFAINGASVVVV